VAWTDCQAIPPRAATGHRLHATVAHADHTIVTIDVGSQ